MPDQAIKKVIWAVDLNGDDTLRDQAAGILRTFLAATHATVEPIFVLSPSTRLSAKGIALWEEPYRELARKRLTDVVNRSDLPGVRDTAILVDRESSVRKAAAVLVADAKAKGADLVVVSTHARKGLARFVLGSFAETLMLTSPIPVLSINPSAQRPDKFSRILFPSDFGAPSRIGFEKAVALGKQLGAKIWLYYKSPEPVPVAFPETPTLYMYLEEEEAELKKMGKAWADWGQTHGVEVALVVDGKPGNVSQAILDFAQDQKIDMIAMVTQAGPLTSVVLGSVTRQVLRSAECPVWIQHSKE